MKKYLLIFAALVTAFLTPGCKEEKIEDKITLSTEKAIQAGWEQSSYDIVFTTTADWSASVSAASGDVFFALDKTSGQAGTANLKLTVQTNEANAARSGEIKIVSGTATETITVNQEAVGETSEAQSVTVSFLARDIDYPVTAKPDKVTSSVDWITVGEPTSASVPLSIAQNEGTGTREGVVTIVIVKHTITLTVTQEPESGEMSEPAVSYLGNKSFIYDSENGAYTTFGQYLLSFSTEYGKVNLVLNSNPTEGDIDPAVVPAGTYAVDAALNYADKTFSIAGDNATCFSMGGTEYKVIDGEIEVAQNGSDYSVKASLQDEGMKVHVFTYSGPLGTIAKDDFGANVYDAPNYSNYYTYFAGNNYVWTVNLYLSADPAGKESDHVSSVSLQLVTDPSAGGAEFPTGTFTYQEVDFYSANTGYVEVTPGTFSMSGNTLSGNPFKVNSAALTVSKDADGKYTFSLTSNILVQEHVLDADGYWATDENWEYIMKDIATYDWNPVVTLALPDAVPGMTATPDAESVTFDDNSNAGQYLGFWYSDIYGAGMNAFAFGWNNQLNGAYTLFLTVNTDQEYVYEKDFNNRFCSKPVPAGTYTFSNEAAANTLLPTARCYVKNNYTGTTFRVNGGSITVTDSAVTLNAMTGKDTATGNVCTFNGSFGTSCYYFQDYSDHTKRKLPITPVE